VAGIVRTVHVATFQRVHKGDLIVELQDATTGRRLTKQAQQLRLPVPPSKTTFASASCKTRV